MKVNHDVTITYQYEGQEEKTVTIRNLTVIMIAKDQVNLYDEVRSWHYPAWAVKHMEITNN